MASITPLQVGTSASSLVAVRTPDKLDWSLQDVSAADSGRTADANATMHKNRVAQKRKMSLSWSDASDADVSAILQAFNPEYVYVRYRDPMSNQFETRYFYSGDKSAPVKYMTLGGVVYSTLAFDIIEV